MAGQGKKKKSKEKTTKLLYDVHELTLSFKFSCTELEKKTVTSTVRYSFGLH